jgi:hypothetical protein
VHAIDVDHHEVVARRASRERADTVGFMPVTQLETEPQLFERFPGEKNTGPFLPLPVNEARRTKKRSTYLDTMEYQLLVPHEQAVDTHQLAAPQTILATIFRLPYSAVPTNGIAAMVTAAVQTKELLEERIDVILCPLSKRVIL